MSLDTTPKGLIARQCELVKAPLLGGDGWDSPKLQEIGGAAMDGSYFSNHYSTEDSSKQVQDFISRFKATYGGEVPDGLAAMGYDAALVMIDAMKRAGTTDGAKLREALASTKDYPGVTGKITIDAQRNAVQSAVVLKVDGGTFKYQNSNQCNKGRNEGCIFTALIHCLLWSNFSNTSSMDFTGSIYALIALGYTMVFGILSLINFAHGDVYMPGAFIGLTMLAPLDQILPSAI